MANTTNNGTLLLFKSWENAIAMSMDGTFVLYPSRYIVLSGGDYNNVVSKVNSDLSDPKDWYAQRKAPFSVIGDPNDLDGNYQVQSLGDLGNLICGGTINFLNHNPKDSTMFFESIVHISTYDIKNIVHVTNFLENDIELNETIFVENEPTDDKPNPAIEDNTITFDAIMIFYNLYRKAGDSIDETSDAYLLDMPMAIYVLSSSQNININTQEYTQRICIAYDSDPSITSYSSNIDDDTISSIETVMSNFGEMYLDLYNKMNEDYTNLADVKTYYDEFRNSRHVNVPYIKGGWWYVNGKKIAEINK